MKNSTRWFLPVILWSLNFIFLTPLSADIGDLPAGKTISANGTFIPSHPDQPGHTYSDDGKWLARYSIGNVSDENREIINFSLLHEGVKHFSKAFLDGSDLLVSNNGMVAVFDMRFHFKNEVTVHFFSPEGAPLPSKTFRYASLFGFSPSGDYFVAGTDKSLNVFDLVHNQHRELASCSKFAFSEDGRWLAMAREDILLIYKDFQLQQKLNTGLFYPRAIAIDPSCDLVAVAGKSHLKAYSLATFETAFQSQTPDKVSFRDLLIREGHLLAGLHERRDGISRGILRDYSSSGDLLMEKVSAEKTFKTFSNKTIPVKSASSYDPVPWPFEPFDEVHKVWNHYEQHMGDGSGTWSYLHQGLDLEVPIDEPVYAVEEGWVKLVLTIGGDAYWRVAISPVQESGYSDGWLYAHLVQSTIQVDVGDYIELHDYLGDIIYWSADWGHIHFINIHDQGDIWYYSDDEWGINFNPLLALTPNTDETAPLIEEFSGNSKFGYCSNETSNYLAPDNLSGEIDIIAKISDYHGTSNWEQPAYRTYYWVKKHPEGELVFPKTLGQILNHTYSMYNGGYYEAYAPLMYKKDYLHPSPPWMNYERDYFQVLTNNNGDSVASVEETELAFNTADYYDGSYQIFVEAWDEYGNMAVDSEVVFFYNDNISGINPVKDVSGMTIYPNPASDFLIIRPGKRDACQRLTIVDIRQATVVEMELTGGAAPGEAYRIDLSGLAPGVYFAVLENGNSREAAKFVRK